MVNNPLFSIITVTLDNLDGLKKTRESLEVQTCDAYEHVIIDGASNDGTPEYLKILDATSISENDLGLYDAMNKGIEASTGDYLIFMNAGDRFADAKTLALIKHYIDMLQATFLYGMSFEYLNGKRHLKRSAHYTKVDNGMFTHHQAMIYSRKLIGNKRYDLSFSIAADYDFTLDIVKRSENVAVLAKPICIFESDGISQRNALEGRIQQFEIRRKHHFSLGKCVVIFIIQSASHALRKIAPSFYWRLKQF